MYKAVIFDMDGVIVDSMPLQYESYKRALSEENISITEEEFFLYAGKQGKKLLQDIMNIKNVSFDIKKVYDKKNKIYRELLKDIKTFPDIIKLINVFIGKYKLALVSTSSIVNISIILDKLNLKAKFNVILGAEDADRGKPSPDIFLKAASRLGALPAECIVFEDSNYGIEAAKRAGMEYIRVIKGRL